MEKNIQCPICGSMEIGQGKLSGYANIMPVNKIMSTGSQIIADICTDCGYILSMKVKNPEKFK